MLEGPEVGTHCETNADCGGEGPRDELALVVLNQQRGLAHSAVSDQDCLRRDRETQTERQRHVSGLPPRRGATAPSTHIV